MNKRFVLRANRHLFRRYSTEQGAIDAMRHYSTEFYYSDVGWSIQDTYDKTVSNYGVLNATTPKKLATETIRHQYFFRGKRDWRICATKYGWGL